MNKEMKKTKVIKKDMKVKDLIALLETVDPDMYVLKFITSETEMVVKPKSTLMYGVSQKAILWENKKNENLPKGRYILL